MSDQWTLRELAAETGVPERTIRFYISRELLPPPLKGGRGAAYGPAHKTLLETIKKLQAKGMMLAEIGHALTHEAEPAPALPEPETWRSYSVARDVVVMLRAGASPWRTRSLLSALRRFAALVEDETKKEDKGE